MCRRRWRAVAFGAVILAVATAGAVEPPVPTARGFVTDEAQVISPGITDRLTRLGTELQQKTGAEIAVLTIRTTQPLDDFTYGMKVADAWRPGRKRDDSGVLVLVVTDDRKLRVLVGYGLEGILPDGLIGEIQDRDMVPAFKAGRVDEGIWQGVAELARRIAESRGVVLDGHILPPRRRTPAIPPVAILLLFLLLVAFLLYESHHEDGVRRGAVGPGPRGRRSGPPFGGFGGGFGGSGGGGFGGFGGGGFGGGGAGRSW